ALHPIHVPACDISGRDRHLLSLNATKVPPPIVSFVSARRARLAKLIQQTAALHSLHRSAQPHDSRARFPSRARRQLTQRRTTARAYFVRQPVAAEMSSPIRLPIHGALQDIRSSFPPPQQQNRTPT